MKDFIKGFIFAFALIIIVSALGDLIRPYIPEFLIDAFNRFFGA
jgi:hypothetical protein